MNNRVLGTIAMICAPAILLDLRLTAVGGMFLHGGLGLRQHRHVADAGDRDRQVRPCRVNNPARRALASGLG
jgi:hypothetical protein